MPSRFASHRPSVDQSLRRRVVCDSALPSDVAERLRRGEAERLLGEGKVLQSKPRCEVVRLDHPSGRMLLKRHTWGDMARTLRMAMRSPVARKCYEHGHWLAEQGTPTPRPLALVEDRLGPLGLRSYLLTEYIEGEPLFDLIRWGDLSLGGYEQLARQVAEIWQRLIDLEVTHGDLKPENFIVDWINRVWLIDLEKLRLNVPRARLAQQHLIDAESFLHIRTWRNSQAAAELFRQALLTTRLGEWVRESASPTHQLRHAGYTAAELELQFATIVVTGKHASPEATRDTCESARLLSDQIVVVDAGRSTWPGVDTQWILVLRAGERISPDLARHMVEHLLAEPAAAAVKIPLLDCASDGRRQPSTDSFSESGIRAFNLARCRPHFTGDLLQFPSFPAHVVELNDAIEVISLPQAPAPRRRAA